MSPFRRKRRQLLANELAAEHRKNGPTPQEVWAKNNSVDLPVKQEEVVKEEPKKVFNFQKKKKKDDV